MLRITTEQDKDPVVMRLEGKLAGEWVDELKSSWKTVSEKHSPNTILLDLCNVSFIDPEGKELLRFMCGKGAQFKTRGCVAGEVIKEIECECGHLPGSVQRRK